MRWMKWIGFLAAVLLIASCLFTWVVIRSKNIAVSGVDAAAIGLGRPGYFHFFFSFFFLLFHFIPRIWAKRANLLVTALNFAWALRNYLLITACGGGECPEKLMPVYLILVASGLMLVSSFFPDISLPREPEEKR